MGSNDATRRLGSDHDCQGTTATQAHDSQHRPTTANAGPPKPAHTHDSLCRPTQAHPSQHRPTTANAGQRWPMTANEGQHRPTTPNAGSQRPPGRYIYKCFYFILLYEQLRVWANATRSGSEGQAPSTLLRAIPPTSATQHSTPFVLLIFSFVANFVVNTIINSYFILYKAGKKRLENNVVVYVKL